MIPLQLLHAHVERLRTKRPIVHCITNQVAMDFTANTLLSLGASPLMAHALEEMAEIADKTDALLLNIGTLDNAQLHSMLSAAEAMNSLGKPIILDPVGAGFSNYRTLSAQRIIRECHPCLIRGNASEIVAIAGGKGASHGVDSNLSSNEAVDAAQTLAKATRSVVIVSGATDYITNGLQIEQVTSGSPMQALITGMGCAESAVLAAFASVLDSPFDAALTTMTLFGCVADQAALSCKAPGSFRSTFIDLLYEF